jgi:hypothetical protein
VNTTYTIRKNAELKALNLSMYSLSRLARILECVDPRDCLEHRLSHPAFAARGWTGELTLDEFGNLLSFK